MPTDETLLRIVIEEDDANTTRRPQDESGPSGVPGTPRYRRQHGGSDWSQYEPSGRPFGGTARGGEFGGKFTEAQALQSIANDLGFSNLLYKYRQIEMFRGKGDIFGRLNMAGMGQGIPNTAPNVKIGPAQAQSAAQFTPGGNVISQSPTAAARQFTPGGNVISQSPTAAAGASGTSAMGSAAANVAIASLVLEAVKQTVGRVGAVFESSGQIGAAGARNDIKGAANAAGEALESFATAASPLSGAIVGAGRKMIGAFGDVTDSFLKRADDLKAYSGPLAEAKAISDVRYLMADIQEAQRLGPQLAKLQQSSDDLYFMLREMLLPIKEFFIEYAADFAAIIAGAAKLSKMGLEVFIGELEAAINRVIMTNPLAEAIFGGALDLKKLYKEFVETMRAIAAKDQIVDDTDLWDQFWAGAKAAGFAPRDKFGIADLAGRLAQPLIGGQ